jgi:hypothetical protein
MDTCVIAAFCRDRLAVIRLSIGTPRLNSEASTLWNVAGFHSMRWQSCKRSSIPA